MKYLLQLLQKQKPNRPEGVLTILSLLGIFRICRNIQCKMILDACYAPATLLWVNTLYQTCMKGGILVLYDKMQSNTANKPSPLLKALQKGRAWD